MSESSRLRGPGLPGITVEPDGWFYGYDENGEYIDGAFALVDFDAKPTRIAKPSLPRAVAAAKRAGLTVAGATVKPDGSVSLTFGQPGANGAATETADDLRKLI
jgi:hypothetical protein